jgi:hypothetical protein
MHTHSHSDVALSGDESLHSYACGVSPAIDGALVAFSQADLAGSITILCVFMDPWMVTVSAARATTEQRTPITNHKMDDSKTANTFFMFLPPLLTEPRDDWPPAWEPSFVSEDAFGMSGSMTTEV